MYWSAHLLIAFIFINIAIAYLIFLLIKRPTISKSFFSISFLILCVSSVLSNIYDFWIVFRWDFDTWVHLTLINETINSGVFPSDPFFQNQPNVSNYSMIHTLCAELYYFVEVPPHLLLISISSLAVLLQIIFAFIWIRYLLDNEKLALLAVAIYVISLGSFFGSTFHFLWYPFSMGLAVSNLTFLFMLRSLKEDRLKFAFISALFFSITIMFHLVVGAFIFIAIIGFLFFSKIIKGKSQKRISYYLLIILTVGIVFSLFWLGWILPQYFIETQSNSNLLNYGISRSKNVFKWTFRYIHIAQFKIVSPQYSFFNVFNKNLVLIGLIIVGFYKFLQNVDANKATEREIYLLSNAIIPVVLSFTPPLFSFLDILLKGYAIRILIIFPQLAFAAIGLEWICSVSFRKFSYDKFRPFKGLSKEIYLFLLIFLIIGISSLSKYVYYVNKEAEQKSLPMIFAWEDDFTWLKTQSDRKDVILSDPWTSYYIPYFVERKIVAMLPEHSPTFSIDDRVSDALLALDMSTPLDETLAILKKYNVSFILLNLRPIIDDTYSAYKPYMEQYYTSNEPSKFAKASKFFTEIYYVNGVWIYEVL